MPTVVIPDDPARSVGRMRIGELQKWGASEKAIEACENAGFSVVKDLRDRMLNSPKWWCNNAEINQRFKVAIEDAVNKCVEEATKPAATGREELYPESVLISDP